MSASVKPLVVTAGVPTRMPLVTAGVFIDGDVDFLEAGVEFLAGHAEGAEVDEHKVVVGAARNEFEAVVREHLREVRRVFDYLLLILFEFGFQSLSEADGFSRYYMHKRAALSAGEYGLVYLFGVLLFAENHTAAGAS